VLIMAAAVADFRPESAVASKIKKGPGDDAPTIQLARNPDILATMKRDGLFRVGFAAETDDLVANAAAKLESKALDILVANDAIATIGSADSKATLLLASGEVLELPLLPKPELARLIVHHVVAALLERKDQDA
jgi:phosphopantothenoylcysteine decarboxylase/phosphopantothenate--cysteine ligase